MPAASGAAGGAGRIRASDADRDRALDVLAAAFAEGRITAEEHAERIGHVYNLRSQADLAELTGDLPAAATSPAADPAGRADGMRGDLARPARGRLNTLACASLVCAFVPGGGAIAAVILGLAARRQIRRTGESGDGLAVAGITIGGLLIAASLLYIVSVLAG